MSNETDLRAESHDNVCGNEDIQNGLLVVFLFLHRKLDVREDGFEMFSELRRLIPFDDDKGIIHISSLEVRLYPHPDDSLPHAANAMIERSHRQLKNSLRASDDSENWTDHRPLVLLSIRSTLKPDLNCSAVKLASDATVGIPDEMISPNPRGAVEDSTNLQHRLRQFMLTHSPVPPRSSASPSYLDKNLPACSHVYLRCD
ncbi:hypothetical protein SprV_0200569400 [Sparganum proliferum]